MLCRAKQVTARRGQAGVPRARGDEPGRWARAVRRWAPFPPARPRPGTAGRAPGLERLPSALRRRSAAAGPAVPPCHRRPARVAPLRSTSTLLQQVETRQGARAGGRNRETLAALLPPARLGLIQLHREIISPNQTTGRKILGQVRLAGFSVFGRPLRLSRSHRAP